MEDNAAFAAKFDFDFPLLCDTDRSVGLAYGACEAATDKTARRISYLIDPAGNVLKAFPKVDAAAHPEQVLGALA